MGEDRRQNWVADLLKRLELNTTNEEIVHYVVWDDIPSRWGIDPSKPIDVVTGEVMTRTIKD